MVMVKMMKPLNPSPGNLRITHSQRNKKIPSPKTLWKTKHRIHYKQLADWIQPAESMKGIGLGHSYRP